MSLSNTLGLLTLACLFASLSAAGADAPLDLSLPPGTRVRVSAPYISPSKLVGAIIRIDDQSVTIDVPGRSEPVLVLREKIARLDVSEGPRSRGVDAAIGAGIGAGLGGIVGAVAGNNQKGVIVRSAAVAEAWALLGAGLGALIGVAVPPGEHWNEMPATRYPVGFAPRIDHGLNLAVAWNF